MGDFFFKARGRFSKQGGGAGEGRVGEEGREGPASQGDRTSPPTPAPRTITPAELVPPPKFGRSQQERCTHEGDQKALFPFLDCFPLHPIFGRSYFFFVAPFNLVAPFALICHRSRCTLQPRTNSEGKCAPDDKAVTHWPGPVGSKKFRARQTCEP